ncbi:ABC-three component system protein [Ruegeria sp. EL01]|uniref:ABC-three component system protein n=1 Tax=Ruegeria sp. EL01 TaxID=2107578 RepID=UPI000EA7FCD8|nr:ABC-three component system protein [Ruegeria sp. EL01]
MDALQKHLFQLKFRIAFLESQGKAFEDLFSRIMGHAFAGDFQAVRPYGNKGDLKCDGYRGSDKTVFQCYAPKTTKLDKLQAKVDEDFNGAVAHWGPRMERWSFVHNDDDGLPADVIQQLIDLGQANQSVSLGQMSYPEIFDVTMSLAAPHLEDLFGPAPTQRTLAQLDFEALRPVVMLIQRIDPDENPSLAAPSASKLKANDLSDDAAELLRQGRRRERLVEDFFNQFPNPDFGEEIAQGFRDRYHELKQQGHSADHIFMELQHFAGGMSGTPQHQAAVLAVMSYFFERCDIFEDYVEAEADT